MRPLRFHPLYQTRIWGGRALESILGRRLPDDALYGESWECCDRKEAQTVVRDGEYQGTTLHELWSNHRGTVFGPRHMGNSAERFPLLLKILDCREVLSVQVHPPAHMAASLEGEPKTEMWFVAHAERDAVIHAGLRKGVTRGQFERSIPGGAVAELLHSVKASQGQFLILPSGRVHALGAGLLIFEIQQNSDTTYRVFDWNRKGSDGKPRELHIPESMKCIDFDDFEPAMRDAASTGLLADSPYFIVRHREIASGESTADLTQPDDFSLVAVVSGSGILGSVEVQSGDFCMVPAGLETTVLTAGANALEWLEIKLPS